MARWSHETAYLEADGKRLEYRCWGPGPEEAPTIVLLHEGLGCLVLWRDMPERLAARTGWGVMAYSRAGYGQSDPAELPRPLDYMTREAHEVLPQVLDAVGCRRGILMGHSDGATIAAEYAGGVEDFRVRGIVLMAPHFFTEEMGLAEIARARAAFEEGDLKARMA
ncbi:MAG: alpha/beta fold hydrolase, partial [Halomonas sp.]